MDGSELFYPDAHGPSYGGVRTLKSLYRVLRDQGLWSVWVAMFTYPGSDSQHDGHSD